MAVAAGGVALPPAAEPEVVARLRVAVDAAAAAGGPSADGGGGSGGRHARAADGLYRARVQRWQGMRKLCPMSFSGGALRRRRA